MWANHGSRRIVLPQIRTLRANATRKRRRDRRLRARHLARLDVRVSAWTARWRDHFLLMASLRVWDFRVNALIPYRRGRNHAFMLGWGRGPLFLVGSGWVVALRDCLLNHIVPITARSSKSRPGH